MLLDVAADQVGDGRGAARLLEAANRVGAVRTNVEFENGVDDRQASSIGVPRREA
jgi:hypothetical protein